MPLPPKKPLRQEPPENVKEAAPAPAGATNPAEAAPALDLDLMHVVMPKAGESAWFARIPVALTRDADPDAFRRAEDAVRRLHRERHARGDLLRQQSNDRSFYEYRAA